MYCLSTCNAIFNTHSHVRVSLLLPWFSPLLSPFCLFHLRFYILTLGRTQILQGSRHLLLWWSAPCLSHSAVCTQWFFTLQFLAFKPWKILALCLWAEHGNLHVYQAPKTILSRWCSEHTAQNSSSSPGWCRVTHLLAQDARCRSNSEPPALWIFFLLFCC